MFGQEGTGPPSPTLPSLAVAPRRVHALTHTRPSIYSTCDVTQRHGNSSTRREDERNKNEPASRSPNKRERGPGSSSVYCTPLAPPACRDTASGQAEGAFQSPQTPISSGTNPEEGWTPTRWERVGLLRKCCDICFCIKISISNKDIRLCHYYNQK